MKKPKIQETIEKCAIVEFNTQNTKYCYLKSGVLNLTFFFCAFSFFLFFRCLASFHFPPSFTFCFLFSFTSYFSYFQDKYYRKFNLTDEMQVLFSFFLVSFLSIAIHTSSLSAIRRSRYTSITNLRYCSSESPKKYILLSWCDVTEKISRI